MSKSKGTKVTDRTKVTMRLGNLLALIASLCASAYVYASIVNRLAVVENDIAVDQVEITMNTEFRTRWPRGELGRLPDDVEQDIRIRHLEAEVRRLRDSLRDECN